MYPNDSSNPNPKQNEMLIQLQNYVDTMRKTGQTDQDITARLKEVGWQDTDIATVLSLTQTQTSPTSPISQTVPTQQPFEQNTPTTQPSSYMNQSINPAPTLEQSQMSPQTASITQPQTSIEYKGILSRFLAQVLDVFIFGFFIYYLITPIIVNFFYTRSAYDLLYFARTANLTAFLNFIFTLIYFTLFEGFLGATPGKLLCKIKVVKEDGSKCTPKAALIRNVLRIADILPFAYILGIYKIKTSPKKQRFGDEIAHTVVIKK